jgi:hypothetical protein
MSSTSTRLPTPDDPGHRLAEEASKEMVTALREFLASYREDGGGVR